MNKKLSLYSLTMGGFSIGITEFMMMGVLPDVAKSLDVTIPVAGHLISAYALGVVIGAPLMVALAGNFPPKKALIGLMLAFGVFNSLFAIAPGYEWLVVARLFSGLPHGAFFGMGAVVASRLAEPGKEASAVSVMFAGLTVANIIGVPLGTYIGHNYSWRISFLIVGVVSLMAAGSVKLWMPHIPVTNNTSFLRSLGNFMGGRLADRFSPIVTTGFLLLAMIFSLLMVSLVSQYKVPAIIMTFVTGSIAFAVIAPMQMLMINTAKGAEMLASSSMQASANIGNALGAFLGGLPLAAGYSYTSPEYVGAALAFTGLLLCALLYVRLNKATPLAFQTIK